MNIKILELRKKIAAKASSIAQHEYDRAMKMKEVEAHDRDLERFAVDLAALEHELEVVSAS